MFISSISEFLRIGVAQLFQGLRIGQLGRFTQIIDRVCFFFEAVIHCAYRGKSSIFPVFMPDLGVANRGCGKQYQTNGNEDLLAIFPNPLRKLITVGLNLLQCLVEAFVL